MAKAAPIQTSFNGGIQTPLLDGHINAPRREASYKDSTNLVPLKHGPLVRRGGTKHVMEQRSTVSTRAHLIPFYYNDEASYVLEISGDSGYGCIMRAYKDNELILNSGEQRSVTDVSLSGGVAEVTVSSALPGGSYITGSIVFFDLLTVAPELNNGYYKVKEKTSSTTFTLTDYYGNDITSLSTSGACTGIVKRPMNVILPYCYDDLFDADGLFRINYAQSNDVIYLAHPDYPLQALTRTSDTAWTCTTIDFDNGPWFNNETDIELDVAATGTSRRYTVSMYEADNSANREYVFSYDDTSFNEHITGISAITEANPCQVTITHTTTATIQVPIQNDNKITLNSITGDRWPEINGKTFIAKNVTNLTATTTRFDIVDCVTGANINTTGFGTAVLGSATAQTTKVDRLMRIYFENSGGKARYRWGRITALTATAGSGGLYADAFWTIDEDKKKPASGWLNVRYSGTTVSATGPGGGLIDTSAPAATDRIDSTDWALGAYSERTGYPSTVAIHEGRVWIGGNTNEPRRMDGSAVGRFSPTRLSFQDITQDGLVKDNLAISVSIGGGEGSPIAWSESTRNGLCIGTTNRVGILTSSKEAATMTPENVSYKMLSTTGCADLKPFQMDSAVMFVNRVRRRLHELAYNLQNDGYAAPDITELAEHLTRSGIQDMAYQQEPLNTLWIVLTDGSLISLTYEKNADVVAWTRHILGGTDVVVQSVAVAPSAADDRDQLWLAVSRTINSQTRNQIEYMERWYEDDIGQSSAYHMDNGRSYVNGITSLSLPSHDITNASPAVVTRAGHGRSDGDVVLFEGIAGMTELNDKYCKVANSTVNTFELNWLDGSDVDSTNYGDFTQETTGAGFRLCDNTFNDLNHIEGETVQVYADGRWLNDRTVSSGSITLGGNEYGAIVQVGLPYTWTLQTHRIEAGAADGTAQGKIKRIEEVIVRLRETLGLKYGGSASDLYDDTATCGANASVRTPLFTGDTILTWPDGYSREGYMYFKGEGPFPAQIQAIMPKVTTND